MKAARRTPPTARPARARPAPLPSWLPPALIAFGIGLAVWAVYAQVSSFVFLRYDDPDYVLENLVVHRGVTLETIRWAFTTGFASNWHPLTWISHMLDWQIFGQKPGLHHLVNVAIHSLSSMMLFVVCLRMTGARWRSALVAAIFALHPLHVESVAWISERKDVLSGLFWMLTMLAYTSYVRRPGPRTYATTLGLFALGLLSKPMLVTLPFVLLLVDVWPLRRWNLAGANRVAKVDAAAATVPTRRVLLEKVPMLAMAAASSLVTYLVQNSSGAVTAFGATGPGARLANAVTAYAAYIGKTLWPVHLALFYPWRSPVVWKVALAAVLLSAVSVLAVRGWRKRPWFAVGWCWFLGTLVPVIGLVQVGRQAFADRYMYVPQIGLAIMAAWGLAEIATTTRRRWAAALGSALVVLLLGLAAARQTSYWKEGFPLFEHAIQAVPDCYEAYTLLGIEWHMRGDLERALAYYQQSLRINPNYFLTRSNLGLCLAELGRLDEALPHLNEALRLNPGFADAHRHLGLAHAERGNYAEAEKEIREAIRLAPRDAVAYYFLGELAMQRGDATEARSAYEKSVQLRPDYANAQTALQVMDFGSVGLPRGVAADSSAPSHAPATPR